MQLTIVERFMSKVCFDGLFTHWLWQGACNSKGYGSFWMDGRARGAHCAAWELFTGQILLPGQQVDHVCEVINCVNPAHLQVVTIHENLHYENHGRLVLCFIQPWDEPGLRWLEHAA